MKVRYLEVRSRAKQSAPLYVVNPPQYVRKAVQGADYQQFEDKQEAIDYAIMVHDMFKASRKARKESSEAEIAPHDIDTPKPVSYVDKGTVQGIIHNYFGTRHWKTLKPGSKDVYRRVLKASASTKLSDGPRAQPLGEMLARSVSASYADKLHERLVKSHSVQTANLACAVLRRVWSVSLRHGLVSYNPFLKMGLQSSEHRTVIWSPEELDTFIETADTLGYHCVGTIALMCYTFCQRPGDMRNLTHRNIVYDNGRPKLQLIQEKTGADIKLDIPDNVLERLDKYHKKDDNEVLVDSPLVANEASGKQLTRQSMCQKVNIVKQDCGLRKELALGDLRRTGATELAETGATEDELRAVTGHKSREIVSRYVRLTDKLASSAMNKRFKKTG